MTPQQRIRLARRHAGLSQQQLALAAGVHRSAVSHWEGPQGKHPTAVHIGVIARITGIQFEWLATGRGRMALSKDAQLDSVATADAMLVEDALELRMLTAFREAPARSRLPLVEVVEQLASGRTGRPRSAATTPDLPGK